MALLYTGLHPVSERRARESQRQATNLLSEYAKRIVGVDISDGQIENAKLDPEKPKNVEYYVGPSEDIPFIKDSSVDMVAASQCFHWFDHPRFYKECKRILKPGGVLSIFGYTELEARNENLTEEQNANVLKSIKDVYNVLNQTWHPVRKIMLSKFEGIVLPFDDVQKLELSDVFETDVGFLLGFFQTLSPFHGILKEDPAKAEELLETARSGFKEAFGDLWKGDETPLTVLRPYCMLLGRKSRKVNIIYKATLHHINSLRQDGRHSHVTFIATVCLGAKELGCYGYGRVILKKKPAVNKEMAKRFFESETHTFLYSKFRRPITETIINPAVEYLSELSKPPCDLVVDVGCGTGQSTNLLSKYAKRVFGVDISEGQIKYANENPDKPENVDYFVGPSEDMAFVKNCSVDMVSASSMLPLV
ncbi:putative methyltransferase [Nymphon striatum]|nr:putative methyltransferase [Nymphon striatum]